MYLIKSLQIHTLSSLIGIPSHFQVWLLLCYSLRKAVFCECYLSVHEIWPIQKSIQSVHCFSLLFGAAVISNSSLYIALFAALEAIFAWDLQLLATKPFSDVCALSLLHDLRTEKKKIPVSFPTKDTLLVLLLGRKRKGSQAHGWPSGPFFLELIMNELTTRPSTKTKIIHYDYLSLYFP